MSKLRHGGRSLRYAWRKTTPGAGLVANIGPAGAGVPPNPGSGSLVALSWEVLVPAVTHGNQVDWTGTYPGASLPGGNTLLPLIQWTKGLEALGAFTKENLAIYDFQVFAGSDVTDATVWGFATTSVKTQLYCDTQADSTANQFKVREGTALGAPPAPPSWSRVAWTTDNIAGGPYLLNVNAPMAFLQMQNTDGAVNLAAGRLRVQMLVGEL